ncbi:MAG: NUDIX domain-containing protein [Alphaproteobacteria bacterium]
MPDKPKITARKTVFDGWNRLEILTIAADGTSHDREVFDHGDVAAVLPVDRARRVVLLARQWRAPALARGGEPYLLEACAGLIDPGETPDQTAIREAWEELGVKLTTLEPVGSIQASPGTLAEIIHLYIAPFGPEDRQGDGGGLDHEGEAIETVEMGFDELFAFARKAEAIDGKTLILAQHLMLEQGNKSSEEAPTETPAR